MLSGKTLSRFLLMGRGVFDKVARILRLPPSPTSGLGPVLEEYAARAPLPPYDQSPVSALTRPLSGKNSHMPAFSFSGLLSAAERLAKQEWPRIKGEVPPENVQREVSRAFQTAAVRHLADKVRLAIDSLGFLVNGLVVSGGVGSNKYLREQ